MAAVRQTFSALAAAYLFHEALATLEKAHFTEAPNIQARDALLTRAKRIVAFQRGLIADMNARGGFPGAVVTRLQASYPQGFASANAEGAQASTLYGVITVLWTDLSPETLLAMAKYFADTPEKRLNGAAFALEMGRTREAQHLPPQPTPAEQQPAGNPPPARQRNTAAADRLASAYATALPVEKSLSPATDTLAEKSGFAMGMMIPRKIASQCYEQTHLF